MWRYLGRRLIQVPLVLLVVSLMTFLITRATPGDPVQIMLGMQTSPEAAAAMRAVYDDPAAAAAMGQRAQADLTMRFSPAATGKRMKQRLDQIRSERDE